MLPRLRPLRQDNISIGLYARKLLYVTLIPFSLCKCGRRGTDEAQFPGGIWYTTYMKYVDDLPI
jgi:hypothetical protein